MTNTEDRALFVATMRALTDWTEKGGDLAQQLLELARCAVGDVLPDELETLPLAVPTRRLDDVERRKVAIELVRRDGRTTSGRLGMASYCSDETARGTLEALSRRGVLRHIGRKKGSMYVAGRDFPNLG